MTCKQRNRDYYFQALERAHEKKIVLMQKRELLNKKLNLIKVKMDFNFQFAIARLQRKNPDEFQAIFKLKQKHVKYIALYFHERGYHLELSFIEYPQQWHYDNVNELLPDLSISEDKSCNYYLYVSLREKSH